MNISGRWNPYLASSALWFSVERLSDSEAMPKVKARVGVGKRAIGNVRETKRCVAAVMKQRDECAMRISCGRTLFLCVGVSLLISATFTASGLLKRRGWRVGNTHYGGREIKRRTGISENE